MQKELFLHRPFSYDVGVVAHPLPRTTSILTSQNTVVSNQLTYNDHGLLTGVNQQWRPLRLQVGVVVLVWPKTVYQEATIWTATWNTGPIKVDQQQALMEYSMAINHKLESLATLCRAHLSHREGQSVRFHRLRALLRRQLSTPYPIPTASPNAMTLQEW